MSKRVVALVILILVCVSGCARLSPSAKPKYHTLPDGRSKHTERAQQLHTKALQLLCERNLDDAECVLREALAADVNFGPAHNTLGKLYFDKRDYFMAAWEFDHALETMPSRAEPHNNLGLVYETADRLDQAIEYYETAWSMDENHPEYLGNLVRARTRRGDPAFELQFLLQRLVEIDTRPAWVDWARGQLIFGKIDSEIKRSQEDNEIVPFQESPLETIDSEVAPPSARLRHVQPESDDRLLPPPSAEH